MRSYVTLRVGTSHSSSANGDTLYLICHVSSQDHVTKESNDFVWELLAVHHYHDRFGDQKHYDMGDLILLICPMTSV